MGNLCTSDETREKDDDMQIRNKTSLGQLVEDNPFVRLTSIQEHLQNRREKLFKAKGEFRAKAKALAQNEEKEKAYSTVLKIKQTDEFIEKTDAQEEKVIGYQKEYEQSGMDEVKAMAIYLELMNDIDREDKLIKLVLEANGQISKEDALNELDMKREDHKALRTLIEEL